MEQGKVKEWVHDVLVNKLYLREEEGMLACDIQVDSDSEISERDILRISKADNPMEMFHTIMDDFVLSAQDQEYIYVYQYLRDEWTGENLTPWSEVSDTVIDFLDNNVAFYVTYDHYLGQEVLVDVIVDTGDGDYDFSLNDFRYEDEIADESSILWLARQQGYTKEDLCNAIFNDEYKNSKFLKSVAEECYNTTSPLNALTFFLRMSLVDYINLKSLDKPLIISKDTTCGLYDAWYGAGGLLGIELERDVVIPSEYLQIGLDGEHGYSVQDIWGVSSDMWTPFKLNCTQ